MPFTPYHFGPGIALKAAAPDHVSFTMFCYSQVVTDLEPGINLLMGNTQNAHGFFHTFLGATAVAIFCALTGQPVCEWFLRLWQRPAFRSLNRFFDTGTEISWGAAFFSAFVGTYSHVFLDSFLHADQYPFAPFSDDNPFLGKIRSLTMRELCVAVGVVGVLFLLTVRRQRPAA